MEVWGQSPQRGPEAERDRGWNKPQYVTDGGHWKRETGKRGTGKPGTKSQGWKTRDRKTGESQSYGKPSL